MKFLLDTNSMSFAIRGVGRVGQRLLPTEPSDVAISSVTEAELWFGGLEGVTEPNASGAAHTGQRALSTTQRTQCMDGPPPRRGAIR